MGSIIQFAQRLEGGDWTPSERSQLREMAAQLSERASGLDLVFGMTEEGDPWCVVADQRSEVMLHIARIGNRFVVHSPRDDEVIEERNLWLAMSQVWGGVLRDRRGVVLPLLPTGFAHPGGLTVMVAEASRGDGAVIAPHPSLPAPQPLNGPAEVAPLPAHHIARADPLARPDTDHTLPARHGATASLVAAGVESITGTALAHNAANLPTPVQSPQPALGQVATRALASTHIQGPLDAGQPVHAIATPEAQAPARTVAEGEQLAPAKPGDAGTPVSTGAPAVGDGSQGGSGSPQGGSPQGGPVQGAGEIGASVSSPGLPATPDGAVQGGDFASHRIAVSAGAIVQGADGSADLFVLTLPARGGFAPASLGTVQGFAASEGDRLVFADGSDPRVVDISNVPTPPEAMDGQAGPPAHRISYDIDGDGRADAFVVVMEAPSQFGFQKAADTAVVVVVALHQDGDAGLHAPAEAGVFIGH